MMESAMNYFSHSSVREKNDFLLEVDAHVAGSGSAVQISFGLHMGLSSPASTRPSRCVNYNNEADLLLHQGTFAHWTGH